MPNISIYVLPSDIESAEKIAKLALPEMPDYLKDANVLAWAVAIGMEELREHLEKKDQVNMTNEQAAGQ